MGIPGENSFIKQDKAQVNFTYINQDRNTQVVSRYTTVTIALANSGPISYPIEVITLTAYLVTLLPFTPKLLYYLFTYPNC